MLEKPIDFSTYTFRASSCGKLMTNPRGKSPMQKYQECQEKITGYENSEKKLTSSQVTALNKLRQSLPELQAHKDDIVLSDTAISYLLECYLQKRFGIKKDIDNKYVENGKLKEDDSIALLREVDEEFYVSYKKWCEESGIQHRKYNEHVEGECDILYPLDAPEMVQDVKSCWSLETFQPHTIDLIEIGKNVYEAENGEDSLKDVEQSIKNAIYYWQGIVYCALYGVSRFILRYCLVDMPQGLVEDEYKRILYKFGKDQEQNPEYQDACLEFLRKVKVPEDLPLRARIISFEVKYDQAAYLNLCSRIEISRKWLNNYAISEWERETGEKWKSEQKEISDVVERSEKIEDAITEMLKEVVESEQGFAFEGGYVDEVTELTKEQFDFLKTRTKQEDANQSQEIQDAPASQENSEIEQERFSEAEKEEVFSHPLTGLIDSFKSAMECVEFYMDKNDEDGFWEQNQELKSYLDKHKTKLSTPEPPKQSKSKPAPVAKEKFSIPTAIPVEGDAERLVEIRNQMNFLDNQSIRTVYLSNRIVVDRNPTFRAELNKQIEINTKEEINKIKERINIDVSKM